MSPKCLGATENPEQGFRYIRSNRHRGLNLPGHSRFVFLKYCINRRSCKFLIIKHIFCKKFFVMSFMSLQINLTNLNWEQRNFEWVHFPIYQGKFELVQYNNFLSHTNFNLFKTFKSFFLKHNWRVNIWTNWTCWNRIYLVNLKDHFLTLFVQERLHESFSSFRHHALWVY